MGQQDGAAATAACGRTCLAVMQEVEGLLQLVAQPVLLQLLGGQQWQELVRGLLRCEKLLTDILQAEIASLVAVKLCCVAF